MKSITYLDECSKDYAYRLTACETLEQLKELVLDFAPLTKDAIKALPKDDIEFAEFQAGLKKERNGIFSGLEFFERYSSVMLPEVMFLTTITANEFGVPWGAAYLRLVEGGRIAFDESGNAHLVKKA